MTSVVKIVNYYKISFSNNLVKVGNCRKEDYLSEKYRSSVLKRPLLRTFCDFRCCNFNSVFLAFSKIRLPAEAGLQSAVSPFVFKINENFFHHSKLHFHTFPLISITQYAIFPKNVSFCRDETHLIIFLCGREQYTIKEGIHLLLPRCLYCKIKLRLSLMAKQEAVDARL